MDQSLTLYYIAFEDYHQEQSLTWVILVDGICGLPHTKAVSSLMDRLWHRPSIEEQGAPVDLVELVGGKGLLWVSCFKE